MRENICAKRAMPRVTQRRAWRLRVARTRAPLEVAKRVQKENPQPQRSALGSFSAHLTGSAVGEMHFDIEVDFLNDFDKH